MNALLTAGRHFERRFYLGAGFVALGLVFWGFAPTYYLKTIFGAPQLSTRLHIHGAVMSSWLLLFLVQACLLSARRPDLHRRLGIIGVVVAIGVVLLGSTTTINAAVREVGRHSDEANARVMVLCLELIQMALFAGLVAAGIAMRRRSDFHKRLLLLATACMMPSAFSRIPLNLTFMVSNNVSIRYHSQSPPAPGFRLGRFDCHWSAEFGLSRRDQPAVGALRHQAGLLRP